MRSQRRSFLQMTPRLEALDARIVPSTAHVSPATVAAIHADLLAHRQHHAHAHIHAHHSVHTTIRAHRSGHFGSGATFILPNSAGGALTSGTTAPTIATRQVVAPRGFVANHARSFIASPAASSSSIPVSTSPGATVTPTVVPPVSNPTTPTKLNPQGTGQPSTPAGTTNTPPANMGQDLGAVYQAFQTGGIEAVQKLPQAPVLTFQGNSIGISAKWNDKGTFNDYMSALQTLGMQVNASSATNGIVSGFLPINQLVAAAQLPQTASLSPNYLPVQRS